MAELEQRNMMYHSTMSYNQIHPMESCGNDPFCIVLEEMDAQILFKENPI